MSQKESRCLDIRTCSSPQMQWVDVDEDFLENNFEKTEDSDPDGIVNDPLRPRRCAVTAILWHGAIITSSAACDVLSHLHKLNTLLKLWLIVEKGWDLYLRLLPGSGFAASTNHAEYECWKLPSKMVNF